MTRAVTKRGAGYKLTGTVRYFPDSSVEIDVTVVSDDGTLKVVAVQGQIIDKDGKMIRSLERFEVGTDGKVKGIPTKTFKALVAGYHVARAHDVAVNINSVNLNGRN